jgi:hypothetical protein
MARKLKSGIVGQAQVIFGGAIRMELGWVKSARGEELAIGMAELKHPAAKAGDPINDEETYNGIQVTLVFPGFEPLNSFRHILDLLEAELKKRIAERDAQQKIDFDDADPSHLVHEHIDPPAQGEQKPAEWSEEDEKTLNEIFSVAARASLRKSTLFGKSYDYIKWQNWLKSLRGRVGCEANCTTMWKPSEAQMAALMSVASGFEVTERTKELLKELFVELKKLREE